MARNTETDVTKVDLQAEVAPAGDSCLVVFYGQNIGRRYFLNKPELIIGRSDSANIQVDQDSCSRHHCKIMTQDGRSRIHDLDSTNGTFVNNYRVGEADLRDGDIIRVGQTIFKHLSGSNIENKYHEEIYRLSTIDGLTETYNKRFFLDALERELNRAARYGRGVSLALFDIDHFKVINDTHGHLAGDYVLRELARVVRSRLRGEETFARYGGEEFCIIAPETPIDGARVLAEDIRRRVQEAAYIFQGEKITCTISCGVHMLGEGDDGTALIKGADENLYT